MLEVDVDNMFDARGVRYIGKATKMPDGTWRSLANVGGALCVVECKVRFSFDHPAPTGELAWLAPDGARWALEVEVARG